jgi:hypothetical protein
MYNVYFDNILQDAKDIININDSFETSIVREDGFSGTEQIIREKSETLLQFTGQAYKYVNSIMKENPCAEIQFKIEDSECGYIYNGIIPVTSVELSPSKYIGKTTIKDNSFSAYIREYFGVKVDLFNRKTIGCLPLDAINKQFELYKTHNNTTDIVAITAYDALDIFKFLVGYFTDNTINVVSDYLTNNRYAITTGYNMHNYAASSGEVYPVLSIQELFSELRKKLNLYMGIEYDEFNNPYLRIEQQSYFFLDSLELFSIDELPKDIKQDYDIKRDFNEILIGSETTKEVGDSTDIHYPQDRYTSWNKESYSGCGTCTGEKDSVLELVSIYVIDSNIIYEVLNWGLNDYEYDSNIFMFNYEVVSGVNVGVRTLLDGTYFYNETITNENVLSNWIDYYGKCISITRYPKNGFKAEYAEYVYTTPAVPTIDGGTDSVEFNNIVYDLNGTVKYYTGSVLFPANVDRIAGTYAGAFNYFEAPLNGNYNLRAQLVRLLQTSRPTFHTSLDVQLQIITYTDNTFTSIINTYSVIGNTSDAVNIPTSLTLETGNIALNAGECAMLVFSFYDNSGIIITTSFSFDFTADNIIFELLSDGTCETLDYNNQNSKPYQVYFDYPLCYSDYLKAINNKGGYISIKNNKYWIKELIYRHKKMSGFILIGNDSL